MLVLVIESMENLCQSCGLSYGSFALRLFLYNVWAGIVNVIYFVYEKSVFVFDIVYVSSSGSWAD